MPIENFKNFKAPELKYLILVQLKLPVWWSEAYLLGNAFWVSFWLISVGWASCRLRNILLSGVEIFLMGECNGIATGRYINKQR